jgi:hypothetical protein
MEEVIGEYGHERGSREVVSGPKERVTQTPRVILGDKLQLQRPLVIARHGLQHGLVRVGDDDGPEQPGIGGLIECPVEHRLQTYRQHFFG